MASIISAGTTSGTSLNLSGDTSGVLQLASNGSTTAVTIDTSQNVGIGTSSPSEKLEINNGNLVVGNAGSNFTIQASRTGANASSLLIGAFTNEPDIKWTYTGSGALRFTDATASAERMRIDSNGNLCVRTTTVYNTATTNVGFVGNVGSGISVNTTTATNGATFQVFLSTGTLIGSISNNNNTGTLYNTTSDYRLKENITPMTGALAKVAQLKPVTYTWKVNGFAGQGFIAHELQAVAPDCVSGDKDAVETYTDEDGNEQTKIKPQGVDTSGLVATLTAAIQELKAELDATKAEVQALKGTL